MCVSLCVLERKREGQRERDHLIFINLLVQSLAATESGVSHSPYIHYCTQFWVSVVCGCSLLTLPLYLPVLLPPHACMHACTHACVVDIRCAYSESLFCKFVLFVCSVVLGSHTLYT